MQKIAAAFVKAQQGFEPARKTANNLHFRSGIRPCDMRGGRDLSLN